MLQERVETRFYVTGLSFAADLCEIISTGISTPPRNASEPSESHFELIDASPTKNTFSDIRERRKLGKRILKAVQPYLETALRVESEISQKPFETLQKELETMVDNSVETGRPAAAPSREEPIEEADDTIMVDAPQALQITVKGSLPEEEDAMDTGEDGDEHGGNIEVNTSGLGIIDEEDIKVELHNGIESSDTPPDTDGYVSRPRPVQSGPPTPPQSNGSLGRDPADPLTEGGVLWYLKGHEPRGTSVLGEHWAGRDAVRMLSEDLTDMDDEELKGLGMDVDHGVSSVAVEVNGHVDAETTAAKSKASKVKKRRTSTRRR